MVPGKCGEGKGDPVPVHEHAHLHDGIGTVLLALAVFHVAVLLFNLKVIVRAVVVEDAVVPFSQKMTVFIDFGLDEVTFLCKNAQGAVNVMELVGGLFQKLLRRFVSGKLAARIQDAGIDQVGKDGVYVIIKLVPVPDLAANGVKAKPVVESLQEEVASHEALLPAVFQLPVGPERNGHDPLRLFLLVLFCFNACLFPGPGHDAIAIGPQFFGQFPQRAKLADDDGCADALIIQITFGYVKGFGIF